MKSTIHILYGTTTGNSEVLAEETAEKLQKEGFSVHISSMEDFKPAELYQIETLLAIVSTDNDGDPPWSAEALYQFLHNKTEADLGHISYSVLALGDSYYPDFCQAGKDFDYMLEKLGANKVAKRVDCDIDFWENYDMWLDNVLSVIVEKEKVLNY